MIFVEWQARNMTTMVERRAAMVPSRLSVNNIFFFRSIICFSFFLLVNNIEFWIVFVYLPVCSRDGVVYEGGRGDGAVDEKVEAAQQQDRHQTWAEAVFGQTPTKYDLKDLSLV